MKKRLGILVALMVALAVISVSAFGFFNFGYTHGIPDNDGKMYAGFAFGPDNSEFNVNFYLGDMWTKDQSLPKATPNDADLFLGLEAFYSGSTDVLDVTVGSFLESPPLVGWPGVGVEKVGFYGDLVVHVLPQTDSGVVWDLFASFELDVTGGDLGLKAEVGFEVEL